ncbi:MAG: DUF1801 domain-containing protein [Vallitaleaceae bacterium]|jgi:hypothetical protein|nr:DUF1801 domain-containing protein [Vallitaleaceae bacterium]
MAELKTTENNGNVLEFISSIERDVRRKDSLTMLELMTSLTGKEPKVWGSSIIGFGSYHYKYESGREGDWFMCGFSPRAQALTIYIMKGFGQYESYMEKLGKYKTGKSCLYVNNLLDIDMTVLSSLIKQSIEDIEKNATCCN